MWKRRLMVMLLLIEALYLSGETIFLICSDVRYFESGSLQVVECAVVVMMMLVLRP